MRHNNVVFHHPGLVWHYGAPFSGGAFTTWNELAAKAQEEKTKIISTVCSSRTGKTTLHSKRVEFTNRLKSDIPEMDVFGQGVNPMDDKAEALDSYQYHIAVENHVYRHHLTEKLPDAFLGFTVPFYHGAPNAADYFPKESFIPIDINNYQRSKEIIEFHIKNDEYSDRFPFVVEARRRVLEEQNIFAILSKTIESRNDSICTYTPNRCIRNRSTMRMKSPLALIRNSAEKIAVKSYHKLSYNFRNKPKLI